MRRISLILIAFLLCCASALAAEWNKTYQFTGKPELRVTSSDANITVDSWDQTTVEARLVTDGYKIGNGGIQVYEHQNGNSLLIEVRYPHEFGFHIGFQMERRVDLTLHVPKQVRLDLRSGDGNIQVSGVQGEMSVSSGDGHQEIHSVDGNLEASAGDGHITADGRFDQLNLKTGDGHIQARANSGSKINYDWSLRAGDGSVELQVPKDFGATVELRTGDGHIDVATPLTVTGRLGDHEIRGKMNGGGGLLSIKTGDGSISLQTAYSR